MKKCSYCGAEYLEELDACPVDQTAFNDGRVEASPIIKPKPPSSFFGHIPALKRAMFIFCGLTWFLFGLVVGMFTLRYLFGGAGYQDAVTNVQIFNPVSSGGVLTGLVHVVGFLALTVFCLLIGVGLFLHGLVPPESDEHKLEPQKKP